MTQQNEKYLRELINATAELMVVYKKLEALEEKRVDVGLIFEGDELATFPNIKPDVLSNGQYAIDELKKFMAIHRVNFNRIIP